MTILLLIETHVYQEEQLRDEMLSEDLGEDINSCGIIGPETILPLRRNRTPELLFEYSETTTIKDMVDAIYGVFGFDKDVLILPRIAFLRNNLRYWIDDCTANFQTLINKHIDPENSGKINIAAYVCGDAGSICEEDGIRYYMNSREWGKHYEPHVHLRALGSCDEAVIIIKTRKIIGEFPKKLVKKARKKVEENEKFFLEQWNVLTDGLKVDINHYFGLTKY